MDCSMKYKSLSSDFLKIFSFVTHVHYNTKVTEAQNTKPHSPFERRGFGNQSMTPSRRVKCFSILYKVNHV